MGKRIGSTSSRPWKACGAWSSCSTSADAPMEWPQPYNCATWGEAGQDEGWITRDYM